MLKYAIIGSLQRVEPFWNCTIKSHNQDESGNISHGNRKYVLPHARNNFDFCNDRKLNVLKECKLWRQTVHFQFCLNNREKKIENFQIQTKKDSSIEKNNQDDRLIARVKTVF